MDAEVKRGRRRVRNQVRDARMRGREEEGRRGGSGSRGEAAYREEISGDRAS